MHHKKQTNPYAQNLRLKKLDFWVGFFFDCLGFVFFLSIFFVQDLKFISIVLCVFAWFLALIFYYRCWTRKKKLEKFKDIKALRSMKPLDFEHFIADLLRKQGYKASVVGGQSDRGVDVKATKKGKTYVVQCKRYRPGLAIKSPEMQQFVGSMAIAKADRGIFVTTSHFTPDSAKIAKEQGIELWDEAVLMRLT